LRKKKELLGFVAEVKKRAKAATVVEILLVAVAVAVSRCM